MDKVLEETQRKELIMEEIILYQRKGEGEGEPEGPAGVSLRDT